MVNYKEKIKELEEEIKKTKYNKATQHHIGLVKAKIAILKEKQTSRSSKKTGQSEQLVFIFCMGLHCLPKDSIFLYRTIFYLKGALYFSSLFV